MARPTNYNIPFEKGNFFKSEYDRTKKQTALIDVHPLSC